MKMKKLAMSFAAAALTTVTTADYSGGQKETAAKTTKEAKVAATAKIITTAGTEAAGTTKKAAGTAAEADEENHNIGSASKDNTRNQDKTGENELLVVSFDTNHSDSGHLTIGAIEGVIEKTFPDFAVRRGFISQIIIDRVKSWDDVAINNVGETPDRAEKNGVRDPMVQPIHPINGPGYTDLVNEMAEYPDAFEEMAIGRPLLTIDDDFRAVMKATTEAAAQYDNDETATCFMERGTETGPNQVYAEVQSMFTEAGYRNYYVGTVEVASGLDDILTAVKEGGYKKVVLESLMIVANDHANNDVAGDEEGSWKTAFEDVGYKVTCLTNGLGGLKVVKQLFVEHAQAAADSLTK